MEIPVPNELSVPVVRAVEDGRSLDDLREWRALVEFVEAQFWADDWDPSDGDGGAAWVRALDCPRDEDSVREYLGINEDADVTDADRVEYVRGSLVYLLDDADCSICPCSVPLHDASGVARWAAWIAPMGYSFSGTWIEWLGVFEDRTALDVHLRSLGYVTEADLTDRWIMDFWRSKAHEG